MTRVLLDGSYDDAVLLHVNAVYSDSVADMGRPSVRKVWRLLRVTGRALAVRVRYRPQVLYFHPAGSNRSAIFRDLVLLVVLRPLFPTLVFHLHARGLTEAIDFLPRSLGWVARRAYSGPDVLLGPSAAIVTEARSLNARHERVVPNGTEGGRRPSRGQRNGPLQLLFLNLISEAKGASWLVESFSELVSRGVDARLRLVGEFSSADFERELTGRVAALGLGDVAAIRGPVAGDAKWRMLQDADIFCVPTTYPQESFGLALIEAASCGVAVVAADVPGVRELLEPGTSIALADPSSPSDLTEILYSLCTDDEARASLGAAARDAFERRYTLDHFWAQISSVFALLRDEHHEAA